MIRNVFLGGILSIDSSLWIGKTLSMFDRLSRIFFISDLCSIFKLKMWSNKNRMKEKNTLNLFAFNFMWRLKNNSYLFNFLFHLVVEKKLKAAQELSENFEVSAFFIQSTLLIKILYFIKWLDFFFSLMLSCDQIIF